MIERLLNKIENYASWKKTIIFLLITIILATSIITQGFGSIKLNPEAAMDSLTYYDGTTFYNNLEQQGHLGRQSYLILHIIDYVFIIFFYSFLILTTYTLLTKLTENKNSKYLSLIPIIPMISDLIENLCIDISILIYPNKFEFLGHMSGYFTFIKMNALYVVFILIIALILLMILKIIKKATFN